MAKVSGSYASLARGVSQQPPETRLDGQHTEQINMLSDPVYGLTRRRGCRADFSELLNIYGVLPDNCSTRYFFQNTQVNPVTLAGRRVAVLTSRDPRVVNDPLFPQSGFMTERYLKLFLRDDATPWVPGHGDTGGWGRVEVAPANQAATYAMLHRGIKAVTAVGRYLLLAPNGGTPYPTETDLWMAPANRSVATVWVRGGAYARTFRITATINGQLYTGTYTTPTAAYPGSLNTSDIPYNDTEYTKKVNDRVNAYNSAVTAWIGTAGAAVQPAAIAAQLAASANAASGNQNIFTVVGSHIMVQHSGLSEVSSSDSGDESLMRSVGLSVKSTELLSSVHKPGHVVRIQANPGEPEYFMKAVSETADTVNPGKVRWEEAARWQTSQEFPFLIATIVPEINQPDVLHLAHSPQALKNGLGGAAMYLQGLPDWGNRAAGDQSTSPVPAFAGREVTHMTTFQDRLVVCSNNVVSMSGVGDYFNFYRRSSITVLDEDPVEVFALGAETDIIRSSVMFDKSLLLFGDRQQYSIDGRVPVTPATTTIVQSSAVGGATDAPPVVNGDLVFFAKRREQYSSLYQIEIGDVQDTSNSSQVALQLDSYMGGRPMELLAVESPNIILMRVSGQPRSIYVFRYLDRGRERLLDSWSRFDYPDYVVGMLWEKDQLRLFFLEEAKVYDGQVWTGKNGDWGWLTIGTQSLLPSPPDEPYLDMWRKESLVFPSDNEGSRDRVRPWHNQPFLVTAVSKPSRYWLFGHKPGPEGKASLMTDFPDLDPNHLIVGMPFQSYVTLTPPFKKDRDGTAITDGRLTVNRLTVNYKNTAGVMVTLDSYGLPRRDYQIHRSVLGSPATTVGVIPVTTGSGFAYIGRDSRQYNASLVANDWKPMTITGVHWEGQWFYGVRR